MNAWNPQRRIGQYFVAKIAGGQRIGLDVRIATAFQHRQADRAAVLGNVAAELEALEREMLASVAVMAVAS